MRSRFGTWRWLAVPLLLGVSSCGVGIGPSAPECDALSTAIVMQAQAVAGTEFAACLEQLQPGWVYQDLEAERGRARFLLDSDRMGFGFVEVTLEASCDTSGATEIPSDEPDAPLFVEILQRDVELPLVVVAEGNEAINRAYAHEIMAELRTRELRGRSLAPAFGDEDGSTSDRIAAGLALGRPVIAVGTLEREEGTVELHLPDGDEAEVVRSISLTDALDEIEDGVSKPRYRANWYYPFEGGCVTYVIDASGDGVETLIGDLQDTLGLAPLADARRRAAEEGLVVP